MRWVLNWIESTGNLYYLNSLFQSYGNKCRIYTNSTIHFLYRNNNNNKETWKTTTERIKMNKLKTKASRAMLLLLLLLLRKVPTFCEDVREAPHMFTTELRIWLKRIHHSTCHAHKFEPLFSKKKRIKMLSNAFSDCLTKIHQKWWKRSQRFVFFSYSKILIR